MAIFTNNYLFIVVLIAVIVIQDLRISDAFGTFGFDVHHRYSDPVKGILGVDGLPEKGSKDYFAAMAHRDRIIRGRRLANAVDTPLAFSDSNETYQLTSLGFLYYANVSVGTPSLWFLVALDTGSDLFWLPCDCVSCVHSLRSRNGVLNLNIYSPNISSTSTSVPCNSSFCEQQRQCSIAARNSCPYQVQYLSNNTSSIGILVEDVLHLRTDNTQLKPVNAPIKFGCGISQTGSFLDAAAPNGLFGLGMEKISVPSILASEGLAADSFSMCFGPDGLGRIRFGDKGSSDQSETPFNVAQFNPTYNISVTQIIVGDIVTDLNITAIFDSGTSFTYLTDPAYTILSKNFDSRVKEDRIPPNSEYPFEYCYQLSATQNSFEVSNVNLTMKGGANFDVTDPVVFFPQAGQAAYCLGLVKSEDIDIIGQNFMTGYDIVFDREKMVLGWKASDCYDGNKSTTLPIDPPSTSPPPATPPAAPARPTPPAATVGPEARSGNGSGSPIANPNQPRPIFPSNHSPRLHFLCYTLLLGFSLSFAII